MCGATGHPAPTREASSNGQSKVGQQDPRKLCFASRTGIGFQCEVALLFTCSEESQVNQGLLCGLVAFTGRLREEKPRLREEIVWWGRPPPSLHADSTNLQA